MIILDGKKTSNDIQKEIAIQVAKLLESNLDNFPEEKGWEHFNINDTVNAFLSSSFSYTD